MRPPNALRRYVPAWLACVAAAFLLHYVGGLSWPAVALSALLFVAGATLIVRSSTVS
jgi:hypothetical protein